MLNLRFRGLPKPGHVHGDEQARSRDGPRRGRGGRRGVQAADSQVAAREQGAHLQFSRQRDRRQVVVLGLLDVGGTARGGLAEHVQRGGLVPALTALPGQGQRPLGRGRRLVDAIGEEAGLAEQCEHGGLLHQELPGLDLLGSPSHQGDALIDPPRQEVGAA
jgi:hypothetical protein